LVTGGKRLDKLIPFTKLCSNKNAKASLKARLRDSKILTPYYRSTGQLKQASS
jgi:hypothetical protein